MKTPYKNCLKAFISGLTISTMTFFPLLNVLSENSVHVLHWNNQDTIETLLSWLILGGLIGCLFFFINKKKNKHLIAFFYILMIEIGGFFVAGALVRSSNLANVLKDNTFIVYNVCIILSLILIFLTVWVSTTTNTSLSTIPQLTLNFLIPLNFLMIINLGITHINMAMKGHYPLSTTRNSIQPIKGIVKPLNVILLYDELSVDYLYGTRQVITTQLPALYNLLDNSLKFSNAYLPGGATDKAIPDLFTHEYLGTNLKNLIISAGSKASTIGWSLDYCNTFLKGSTNCRSVSIFNSRTLNDKFSLIHPIWTNLNLLPYQKPFGFLKIPSSVAMHSATLTAISKNLRDNMYNPEIDIVYAHFNIPHIPMIESKNFSWFDRERFLINEISYSNQIRYVDKTYTEVKSTIDLVSKTRPVNLIILSDHNIRSLTHKSQHEHVVLVFQRFFNANLPINSIRDEKIHPADFIIQVIQNKL